MSLSRTSASTTVHPWSAEKANEWYNRKGWMMGCNYAPSSVENQLEMWKPGVFDAAVIDRELSWASKLGFTSLRVLLHHLLWEHDAEGLVQRMETFLSLADSYGIGVVFVFFDSDGMVHASQPARGQATAAHAALENYVKGVISHFANDPRVHMWDIYSDNDAGHHKASAELPLLQRAFLWARAAKPCQPLTAGVWSSALATAKLTASDRFMLKASDVITFRHHGALEDMAARIDVLRRFNRPIICTAFTARGATNLEQIVPLLQQQNVSAYHAGLITLKSDVLVRSDAWHTTYSNQPSVWSHDFHREDSGPFIPKEVNFVANFTSSKGLAAGNIQYSSAVPGDIAPQDRKV